MRSTSDNQRLHFRAQAPVTLVLCIVFVTMKQMCRLCFLTLYSSSCKAPCVTQSLQCEVLIIDHDSLVQFKIVSARSGKPLCASVRVSEASPMLPFETVPMLKPRSAFWLSRANRSVATGNRWSGPMKSVGEMISLVRSTDFREQLIESHDWSRQ